MDNIFDFVQGLDSYTVTSEVKVGYANEGWIIGSGLQNAQAQTAGLQNAVQTTVQTTGGLLNNVTYYTYPTYAYPTQVMPAQTIIGGDSGWLWTQLFVAAPDPEEKEKPITIQDAIEKPGKRKIEV